MKKIVSSLVVASLAGFIFFGCSSEPKSVEEFKKLSKDELENLFAICQKNGNSGKFDSDKKTFREDGNGNLDWDSVGEIQNTSKYSKDFIECGRLFKAIYR